MSSKTAGLEEEFSSTLLWMSEILVVNQELKTDDLPKIKPLLES
jgi:hypothetical protein